MDAEANEEDPLSSTNHNVPLVSQSGNASGTNTTADQDLDASERDATPEFPQIGLDDGSESVTEIYKKLLEHVDQFGISSLEREAKRQKELEKSTIKTPAKAKNTSETAQQLVKKLGCCNVNCQSIDAAKLIVAKPHIISFYGLKPSPTNRQFVCEVCSNLVDINFEDMMQKLQNNEPLFVGTTSDAFNETIVISDSDSGDEVIADGPFLEIDDVTIINENLEDIFNSAVDKYKVIQQMEEGNSLASASREEALLAIAEADSIQKSIQKRIESLQDVFYDTFANRKAIYKNPVEILDPTGPEGANCSPVEEENVFTGQFTVKGLLDPSNPNWQSLSLNFKGFELETSQYNYAGETKENTPNSVAMKKVTPMPRTFGQRNEMFPPPNPAGSEVSVLKQVQTGNQSIPPLGVVPRPPLKAGDTLYVMKNNMLGVWTKGELDEIIPKGRPIRVSRPTPSMVLTSCVSYRMKFHLAGKAFSMKTVNGKQLAYTSPSIVRYPVGTRIIAVYNDVDIPDGSYYVGIIAEPPKAVNKYRYLIFFDDGYTQYVTHNNILLVVESSKNVYEDVHIDSRDFIKHYLQNFPERPMLKLSLDQVIKTEWNGKWWLAKVYELDCSLCNMHFLADKRTEWMYRGSTRLAPLYKMTESSPNSSADDSQPATNQDAEPTAVYVPLPGSNVFQFGSRANATKSLVRSPRSSSTGYPGTSGSSSSTNSARNSPASSSINSSATSLANWPASFATNSTVSSGNNSVHSPASNSAESSIVNSSASSVVDSLASSFLRTPSASPIEPSKSLETSGTVVSNRSVAKKSTSARPAYMGAVVSGGSASHAQSRYQNQVPGYIKHDMYATAIKHEPKKFVPHQCGPSCGWVPYYPDAMKHCGPLAVPLLIGWQRQLIKYKNKRAITYRAPCGRRIRNIDELSRYLRITKSLMGVDYFDFNYWVSCLAEFVVQRSYLNIKDLSDGKEYMSIPCVNYIDHSYPDMMEYSATRLPVAGVYLNLDKEFLIGCDCTDGCVNKDKCACWQLTFSGTDYAQSGVVDNSIGYCHKRLTEPVLTGIYECNSRCKCSSTCSNRVVQNPLRAKLQVFKTPNKGWGIRSLSDMPQGSFICIYAGRLLNEHEANEGGKVCGDEYLAELDYIEVVERLKEGYEEQVKELFGETDFHEKKPKEDENAGNVEKNDAAEADGASNPQFMSRLRARRDTTYYASRKTGAKEPNKKRKRGKQAKRPLSDDENGESSKPAKKLATRQEAAKSIRHYFNEPDMVYIMDAKVSGNIGRYLNHSCMPNVFVQNVFVDTHDLRFPWVAFFALTFIRAGTELTWDYNYDIGSVPNKTLYCRCDSVECRGRLL